MSTFAADPTLVAPPVGTMPIDPRQPRVNTMPIDPRQPSVGIMPIDPRTGAPTASIATSVTPAAGALPQINPGGLIQNPHPGSQLLPGSMQLPLNPQLPQAPTSGGTDADYEAQHAILQADIQRKYNDVLQQLGYMDPNSGQFIQGSVESDAARQRAESQRSIGLADEDVTHQAQQQGTLFSGLRATDQARAEHPFVQSLADLDISVPQKLSDLYNQAGDIVSDYTNQNNALIADLARRRAAAIAANPVVDPSPAPTDQPPLPPPTPLNPTAPTTSTAPAPTTDPMGRVVSPGGGLYQKAV